MVDESGAERNPGVALSILKALDILDCLHDAGPSLNPAQIARRLGMPRPTVYRLLGTLASRGWVSKDPQIEGNYQLGPHILTVAGRMLRRLDIRSLARPYLEELRRRTGESVSLFLLDGTHVIHIDRAMSESPIQASMPFGARGVLHSKAVGKAIMAQLAPTALEHLLARGLEPMTPHTITDPMELKRDLARTRSRGYGVSDQEDVLDLRAVGAAILDMEGFPVGGVAVSSLATRMPDERVADLGAAVAQCASQISERLGHAGLGASSAANGRSTAEFLA